MSTRDYYQILEIQKSASPAEIKAAYRTLSKKYHPDLNNGEKFFEEKFKEIQAAYEVLSDPYSKAVYDDRFNAFRQNPFQESTSSYSPGRPATAQRKKRMSTTMPVYFIVMAIIALFRMTSQMEQTDQNANFSYVRNDLEQKVNSGGPSQLLTDRQQGVMAKQDCELAGILSVIDRTKHLYRLQLDKSIQFLDTSMGNQQWQTVYAVQVNDASDKIDLEKFTGSNVTIKCALAACAHFSAEPPVMTTIIFDAR